MHSAAGQAPAHAVQREGCIVQWWGGKEVARHVVQYREVTRAHGAKGQGTEHVLQWWGRHVVYGPKGLVRLARCGPLSTQHSEVGWP